MPRSFAHADVLLATLRREPIFAYTIPSKLQSYLACGKPVVVALEGEGGRIVEQSGAGWAVPPEDPQALADAVLTASRLTKPELVAMGNRGEAWFREHYERDKVLSRLEAEIAEVAGKTESKELISAAPRGRAPTSPSRPPPPTMAKQRCAGHSRPYHSSPSST